MRKVHRFRLLSIEGRLGVLGGAGVGYNYYGGGCQGKVDGSISSTLTNCNVVGGAFGGGYKAAATTIDVYPTGGYSWQNWDGNYKAFSNPIYPDPEQFTWAAGTAGTSDNDNKKLFTEADMSQMGLVTNDIEITIDGGTVGDGVYGGGNESPASMSATVVVKSDAKVGGSVFGGGNRAPIGQNTHVKVLGTTYVGGNVYGGGNQAEVGGTTTVQVGDECF